MPELPEVETVRRGLQKLIVNKTVESVEFDWPKSFPNAQTDVDAFLIGANIIGVRRRAKVLMIDLSTKYSLVIHLKMTGQLVYRGRQSFAAGHPSDSMINKLPDKSTRVVFGLSDDDVLYFNDQRKFGWVKLLPTSEISNMPFMQKVGPEPLLADFTADVFIARVRRRGGSAIKAVILDQSVLAGVGNIYADESLWGALIHPATKVVDIDDDQLALLRDEIVFVMDLSIKKGGSTDKNYVDAEGKRGSYLKFARVFRREGQACPRCQTIIQKIKVAGRGTHFCPTCQKVVV
ncbi:bifunctional DNA-formamidopyrimidine glycosylase/DNA-(apurinic or apyrimidinic site) lyase [Candidatus Saccharibacteria bacterium]|nr:bifunctional DNA-formamidopyrimidine glycosylase/DNA-(apurinic or apyrimidinic site) lyase [Candidatus Saccharibacteria bacterium]